jgi:hypothetical protein
MLLPPPVAGANGHLAWEALSGGQTCAMNRDLGGVKMPAGMERIEFIEKIIEHTVAHEIGHTLGLRHNFKGSLQGSSVMDYLNADDSVLLPKPGAYDGDSVKYLYGLSSQPAAQAFCTDEQRGWDAECDIFDSSATPLTTDVGPKFTAAVNAQLSLKGSLTYGRIWTVTRYVRAPKSEAQRLEGFNVLMGQVAPPLPAGVPAMSASATAYADWLAGAFLSNLFLDPTYYRDEVGISPSLLDPTFRARAVAVSKGILTNGDGVRSFESRRIAVDVLKAMQVADAYQALLDSRATLLAQRPGLAPASQVLIDDLVKRIDAATSPYFK